MANTLRELTDGYALNQLKLVAEQLTNIGRLDKSLSNNFTFTNELLSANKAALQLKHALAESYNQRLGNIDLSQFNKQLNLTGKTLSDYQQELSMIGVTGNKAFNDLARSVATAEKPLLGMGKIANGLWDTLGNTIKWQASSAIVQGVMKNVASATSYVKQLDNSLNNIQIVTNQSSAYMAEFAKNANRAAQELNTTTNEYAKASLIYYQQGLDNKQVQDRVATTIKLANVSGQSAKVVSDQLTAVWNNFYNGSKNLEFYADAMAALGATTASSSSEIAKGLEKFAAIADSTGLSFEYASSALATVVANTRQSADSVGTSFRTLFSRLQGLSLGETLDDGTTLNKYSKALLSVGVNIKEANGDLKNMDTILTELGSKWQSLAQDEKVALAQTVGGARNYTGLMSLMDNWDDFTTNLKTAQTAQGTLQRQADVYAKSWEAASAHVRAASESIYSNLLNDNFIKGITNLYGDFLGQIGQLTTNLGGAKGTFAGITSLLTQHIFKDKVPGLIASAGETLMGFTSRGSERLEARRQEALNALTTNTNISTYQEVNQAYAKQMQGTLNRQRDFDKAVEQGRIASYEVPIYQQLFQNIDAQKNQAIEQTETAAKNKANAAVSDAYLERAMKTGIAQSRFSDEENKEYLSGLIQQKGLQEDQVRKRQTELDEVKAQREGAMQAKQDAMDHRRQLQNDSENIRVEVDKARSAMDQARTAYNQAVQDYGQNSHEAQVAAGQLGQATKTYNQVNSQHESIIERYMQADERVQTYDTALREHLEPAVRKKQSEYDAASHKLEDIRGDIDYTQANINLRAQDSSLLTGYYIDSNGQRHESNPIGDQIKEARTNANRAVSLEQLAKDLGFGQDMTGDAGDMIRRQAASTIMELVTGADASKLQEMFGTEIGQAISLQGTALTQSVNFSKKKDEDFNQYQDRLKQELMDAFTSEEGGDLLSTLAESVLDASIQASGESKESIANLKALSNRLIDSKLPGGQQIADLIDGIIGNTEEYQAIRARGGVEQAEESLGQRIGSAVKELSKPEQIAKSIGLISNLGMTVSTVEQTFHTLTDETATTGQKMGAFGTALASGYSTFKSISDNAQDLLNGLPILSTGEDGKLKFNNPFTSLGMANLAVMGAMAVGTAAFKTYSAWRENNTTQGRLTQISNDYAVQQQTIAEKRSDKEQLDIITDEYNKQISILRDSLEGSSEYFSTQAEANSIAGNLISRYNLKYGEDYTIQNGTMMIGADVYSKIAEEADKQYSEAVNQGSILQYMQTYLSAQSTIDNLVKNTVKKNTDIFTKPEERKDIFQYDETGTPRTAGMMPLVDYDKVYQLLEEDSTYLSAQGRQQSAIKGIAEIAIQDLANKNQIELDDFVKSAFLNQEDLYTQISKLMQDVEHATIDENWASFAEWISGKGRTGIKGENIYSNEEIWDFLYDAGFISGTRPEDEAAIRAAIRPALTEYYLQDQFIEIANSISDEVKQAFSNYRSLTSEELGNRLQQYDFDSKYKEQLANEVEKVQSNLLAALSANLSPEFLAENNLRDDYLSQLIDNYSLNELEQISNYAIAGGSIFGNEVTQTILENLSSKRNTDVLKQLGKVNWDNTFSALSDINKLARNLGGSENIYSDVLESAIDAMGGENGLFQKLYSSSGFQDVLSKLTDQFDTMGSITTDYVVKLASKNEELSSLLELGRSGYSGLNFNVGGFTKALNLIQGGTLRPGQVTSNLLSALSEGEYSEAVKQNGFAAVDNQNLGRSGTDLLDYFTNAQKAYLNAKSQDLVFDTPLRNVFDTMMPESVRNAYYEANAAAGGGESFQQVMNRADLPQEVKDFLNSTNKKGTKPVTTWAQVNNMYGALIKGAGAAGDITKVDVGGIDISSLPEEYQKLLNEENLSLENYMKYAYGLSFANGNLNLLDTTGNKEYQYTTRETEEHLRKIFEAMGIRNASQLASIHTAQLAESSGGAILRKNDAKAAVDEIISNREPVIPNGKKVYTEAELNAVWESYGTDTGFKTKKEMIDHIIGENAILAPELDTDFWKNNGPDIAGIANKFATANEGYNNGITGGVDGFLSLMEQVGAMKDGILDYDKFKEFMLSTGATEADFDNLFTEDNWNTILGDILSTTVTDKFGNSTSVRRKENETYEDYQKRVAEVQRQGQSDVFSYIGPDNKEYTIDDPLGKKRQHYHPGENGGPGTWDKGWDPSENAIPTSAFVGKDGNYMGINPVTGEMMIYNEDTGNWMSKNEYDAKAATSTAKQQVLNERNIATANMTDEQKKDYYYNLIEREKEGKGETGPKVASTEEGLYYQQQYDFEHMSEADKEAYYQNLLKSSENQSPLSSFEQEVLDTYQSKLDGAKKEEGRKWTELTEDEKTNLVGALTQDNIRNVWDTASDDMKNDLWNLMSQEQRDLLQYSWDKEKYEAKSDDEKKVTQNGIIRAALDPDHYGPQSLFAQEWLQTEEGQKALLEAQQQQLEEQQAAEEQAMLAEQYEKEKAAYEAMSPEEQAYARQMILEQGFDPILGTSLSSFAQELYDQMTSAVDNMPEQTAENEDALDKWALNALDELGLTEDFFNSNPTGNNALPSAYQYLQNYLQSQDSETAAQLAEQLKIQKLIADNTQLTAESTTEQLDYLGEEAESDFQAQTTGQTTEEQAVDENGNPIFGDQGGTTTIINNGSRTDNNGGPGGRSRLGANGWSGNEVLGMSNMISDGRYRISDFGKMGFDLSTLSGSQLQVVAQAQADYDKEHMDTATYNREYLFASGQNNARLLAYASGKEGHIAITGELGPELRVKSDGSMDILGKKGREYAWVDPGDRIYTAQQSAGILKSNKIPGLEGLAKGINNFIPGYAPGDIVGGTNHSSSSSGGGGGGGGGEKSRGGGGGAAAEKDPRYDPQTLKIRDVLERYYTILQQIDNITKAVERFSKVADRAWGRERIRAIEHQNELQQKQYEAQKKYISEIEEYLDTDQSTMTTMIKEFVDGWNKAVDENTDPNNTMERISWTGAQFDQDGVLTNYREFVEKLVEQYNQNAASANQETQYKFQEQIKDIQMYTDTLNLYEEQINALEDIKNAILDTAVKVVTYEVEYKLELSGDTDRILNFQADKYKDDVYQAAKYLELLDQRADLTRKNLETVTEGIMKTLGNYAGENMRVGALHTLDELGVYGTNKFEIPEELLEELDEEDEEDAEKLKELQAERSRNITKQIGAWIDEAYATHKDDVEKIEKMLSFSSEEGAGDFTYDENWRDTYDSWEDYYNEVINKTDNDTERFIDNYEEIVGKLNGLVDFQKVRAQIGDWLEELRTKDAEAAAEIDKIIRYTEDGQIANYSDVLEKLNEANVKLNDEFIELLYTDQDAFFEAMSDFQNNPGWVDFTTEHKDQLTNWMDAIYQYLESLQDTYKQTIEQLGDSVKATSKQMDSAIDEFDYYESVYKEFKNIVDLTNREMTDITKGYFDALNSKSMDNAINKIKGTVTNYHLLQGELEEITRQYEEMQARANAATGDEQIFLQQSADKLKEQMDIANSQFEDAHKNYLSAWEDALNKMSEIYKNTLEEASKDFERSFSPLFNTLALLQAQFDREKALGDLYVDNYQRIHDLNKLNRDIQLSIDDTDNLKGKERLRDLQAEINQLQEDGTELSEYDLDILDKKYKLELARQALEDAKDAKSMVRLARDNNGNWSYVYTANQDDVDKAEQDYEDAIREMEQANEDYIDNIQDQILQVQQEAQQAILALQPEDFATYEDYLAAVQAIQSSMYDTLNFLRSQMNNAFGNNEWLDPYIVDRYGVNNHDLTTNFGDTTLAKLLDSDDLDRSINHMRDNFENNLMSPALEAYLTYSQKQQQVYEAAEHNMATIGEDFGKEMEYVAKMSDNEVQIVDKLSDRVQTAFEDMANVVDEKTAKHIAKMDKLVNLYEKLVEAITRVKELSGENLPIEGGQFIGKIDSWAEIQRLNKELAEHGDYRVLEDLTDLDPEDLQDRKDAMEKATKKIGEWMEALLTDAVDEETKTAIQDMVEKDENGLITNYKQVISKLAQIEKTDENKDTLKEIKKWRATEQKAMYTSPQQVYKENEGLYTNFIAGDQFTKDYLSWITDQLMYNQMKTASESGVTDTEKAEIETYLAAHGGVWVQKGNVEEFFDSWADWQAWYEKNKYVPPSDDGGGSSGDDSWWWGWHWNHSGWIDTGGYTGRWQSADTGMYTGEWPGGSVRRNGRLAWLHQKELVLNAHDTENFLDAMQIVRQLDNLTNWMANGLGDLVIPNVSTEPNELEQNVHIEAEFPNVTDHNEIEQAFNNLVNMASQYANRK